MIKIEDVTGTKGMLKASRVEKTERLLQQAQDPQTGMEKLAARAVVIDGTETFPAGCRKLRS